jgi:hypothetical protein
MTRTGRPQNLFHRPRTRTTFVAMQRAVANEISFEQVVSGNCLPAVYYFHLQGTGLEESFVSLSASSGHLLHLVVNNEGASAFVQNWKCLRSARESIFGRKLK